MFNLIIILLSTLNDEPKGSNNYKIAKYMIENMRDLEECSLTNLAQACYVSNSSISRFCRDIGLKDFNALKNQIAKFSVEAARLKRKFDYENMNPHYLDAQGAVGDARLQMMNLRGSFAISPKVGISAETAWCRRKSHYKYFPDVLSDTFEFRLMFSYHI